jgi:hypothetical protein
VTPPPIESAAASARWCKLGGAPSLICRFIVSEIQNYSEFSTENYLNLLKNWIYYLYFMFTIRFSQ